MAISLTDFRTATLEGAKELLWRQWCGLGVPGHARPVPAELLIDPEALLLATTFVGRHEPRLFDEALDWLGLHGSLINLQRLKNLQDSAGLGDARVLAAAAQWLADHTTQPRWKAFTRDRRAPARLHVQAGLVPGDPREADTSVPKSEPFFHSTGPLAADACDTLFLAHGFTRSGFVPRRMGRPPNPHSPPNLVLALRALIGISARVEVILCLAGGMSVHASELARLTGYAPRTLQALLQEMALSGHLFTRESTGESPAKIRKGANRRYQIHPSDWSFLVPGGVFPRWQPWTALFRLVQSVLTAIPAPGEKERHPAVVSSEIRDTLVRHGGPLADAGLPAGLHLRPNGTGEELLEALARHLPESLSTL